MVSLYFLIRPEAAVPVPSLERVDFGELQVGRESSLFDVSFSNGGERSMRLTDLSLVGPGAAAFSILSDNCIGFEQAPLQSCTVTLQFVPFDSGEHRAGLVLAGNVKKDELGLPLVGLAIAPSIEAPSQVAFGSHEVGSRERGQDLVILNGGSAPLAIQRIYIDGRDARDFRVVRGCGSRHLGVRQSCQLRVSFKPDIAGERIAELVIESDTPGPATSIRLTGSGLWSGPAAAPDPERLSFSKQRVAVRSEPRFVRLTNRSAEPLTIEGVDITGDDGFDLGRESCIGATVEPGRACSLAVVFEPAAEGGMRANLAVRATNGQETEVPLSGEGVMPHITLDPVDVDFGATRVGFSTPPRAVTVSNSGGTPMSINTVTLEGEGRESYALEEDSCSRSELGGGDSCTLQIVFRPSREGSGRAALRIRSDAVEGTATLQLFGGGTVARLGLERSRMNFGAIMRGRTVQEPIYISNTGTAVLEIQSLRVEGSGSRDFVLEPATCRLDQGLAPGRKCRLSIRFGPTVDGTRSATLMVRSNAAHSPGRIELLGVGVAPPSGFDASHTSFDFGELIVGERSGIRTLRVRNPGEGPLVVREIRLSGEHAGDFQIVPGSCEGVAAVTSGGDCTVGLRFAPRAGGARRARLLIRHNGPGERYSVELGGTGFVPTPQP